MTFNFFTGQNNVKIFFEYAGEVIQLPVNPNKISIQKNGGNETVEVIELGEVNILKDPALSSFSIESYFPFNENTSGVLTHGKDYKSPEYLVKFFNNPFNAKEPLRMIITGLWATDADQPQQSDNNNLVQEDRAILLSIESFKTEFEGADQDTLYSLEFKEYKNFGAKTYKSTFKIPQDDSGKFKIIKKGYRKFINAYKSAENQVRKVANVASTASRYANNTVQSLNTIKTLGNIIGTNIK